MAEGGMRDLMRALPVKELDRFLEQAGATLPCPRCGNATFMKMNEVATNQHAALILESLGDCDVPDRTDRFPVVPTTCTRCGWISLHLKAMVMAGAPASRPASAPPVLEPSVLGPSDLSHADPDPIHRLEGEVSEIRSLLSRIDERTFHQSTRADLSVAETSLKGRIENVGESVNESELRLAERMATIEALVQRRLGPASFLLRLLLTAVVAVALVAAYLRWGAALRVFVV